MYLSNFSKFIQLIVTILIPLSMIVFIAGGAFLFKSFLLTFYGTETAGTIVDTSTSSCGILNEAICYHAKVKFYTSDGKEITFSQDNSPKELHNTIGQQIPVVYYSDKVFFKSGMKAGIQNSWNFGMILVIIATIPILLMLIFNIDKLIARISNHRQQSISRPQDKGWRANMAAAFGIFIRVTEDMGEREWLSDKKIVYSNDSKPLARFFRVFLSLILLTVSALLLKVSINLGVDITAIIGFFVATYCLLWGIYLLSSGNKKMYELFKGLAVCSFLLYFAAVLIYFLYIKMD